MEVVGMFWNKNEGDILEQTLTDALNYIDCLYIADDGSQDKSWDIIQSFKNHPNVAHIQQKPDTNDPAQRQSLLDLIRSRHKPEDTWVQIIESDMFLLDTNPREAINKHADSHQLAVTWQVLNGVREKNTWAGNDEYPNWTKPIKEVLPFAHRMEAMCYTFRPLPKLYYMPGRWRPWPNGWSYYSGDPVENTKKMPDSPLLFHVGYRGPTHFFLKYGFMGTRHKRYPSWKLESPEIVEQTVSFFNGEWNSDLMDANRRGWREWLVRRT